jgi:predicted O-methyltransferase YrrM
MNIITLIDNDFTDKHQGHSYAEVYDILFENIQYTAQNILEVGIDKGGSILLWMNYFRNANIYGIDCNSKECIRKEMLQNLKTEDRVVLLTSLDAYDKLAVNIVHAFSKHQFGISNPLFDVIIDDGPHTLPSQKKFIELYSPLLSDYGILIIEDIQDINYLEELMESVPDELKRYVHVYDLRDAVGQYDDILFVINKLDCMKGIDVYNGRIVPISSGKWIHGKWIKTARNKKWQMD